MRGRMSLSSQGKREGSSSYDGEVRGKSGEKRRKKARKGSKDAGRRKSLQHEKTVDFRRAGRRARNRQKSLGPRGKGIKGERTVQKKKTARRF